jgi:hypothetical protein
MARLIYAGNLVVPGDLLREQLYTALLISDYRWWVQDEKIINQWANTNTPGWRQEGMLVYFRTEQDLTAFLLRWTE